MIQACYEGDKEKLMQLLQSSDIEINERSKIDGATGLFVACFKGYKECVEVLLTNQSTSLNIPTTNERSPLFIGSYFGYMGIIELLIQHSAESMMRQNIESEPMNINQFDSNGYSSLFVAAQNGHSKIVNILLQNKVRA